MLILPGMGIISEVIANNTRKPLWGYKSLVGSGIFLGFMSFVVWAHHMFMTGMGMTISAFFQTTTMIISIPSVVILTALIISLWGGSIRFTVPMLFALAFLPMFGIGGLTGLPLGLAAADIHLHDTYYVIGHFHYVVAPGTIFAMFAGIYYWFPKATGRKLNEKLGKIHFWVSLLFINGVFVPMFIQGLAGVSRRLYDGGAQYMHAKPVLHTNVFISTSAFLLLLAQMPFIFNFFWSIKHGKRVGSNVWDATTLEWAATTSPPLGHGNFVSIPAVYRGPYEYSLPGYTDADFLPQHIPDAPFPRRSLTAAGTARRRHARRGRGRAKGGLKMDDGHAHAVDAHAHEIEIPYTVHAAARYGPLQRQARDLALPRLGGHAVRRALLDTHPAAHQRAELAARLEAAERSRWPRSTRSSSSAPR